MVTRPQVELNHRRPILNRCLPVPALCVWLQADMSIKIWNFDPATAGGSGLRRSITNCHKGQNVNVLAKINEGTIASGGGDMLAKIWDLETGTCNTSLKGHTSAVQALAVVEGSVLVTGGADMQIRLWNIEDNYKLVRHRTQHLRCVSTTVRL